MKEIDTMKTLTYAWRFLARSKAYTIINILGLSFSLACCLILMRYIHRELTVDTHCVDRNEVYGVIVDMEGSRGLSSYSNGNEKDSTYIDPRFIEMTGSAITMQNDYVLSGNQRFQANVLAVDSGYLQLFPYQVVEGKLSLDNPQSAYLMEAFARKNEPISPFPEFPRFFAHFETPRDSSARVPPHSRECRVRLSAEEPQSRADSLLEAGRPRERGLAVRAAEREVGVLSGGAGEAARRRRREEGEG